MKTTGTKLLLALLGCICISAMACHKALPAQTSTSSSPAKAVAIAAAAPEALNGAEEYVTCSSCHLATGRGIAGKFPPLAGSPLLLGEPEKPIAIVLYGLEGAVGVEGKKYLSQMGAWGQLSDAQIAAILTYARSSWGNHASAVTAEQVATVRAATADRVAPWSIPELDAARLK